MLRRLHVPVTKPADVQPHLGDPQLHWRAGFSAQELAFAWHRSSLTFPPAVVATLQSAPEYAHAELIDGFFEREVPLDTGRANSQTDLMLVAGLGDELGIIAIEGKVDESFDKLVSEWDTSATRHSRLAFLCEALGLDPDEVGHLRYQLLHRAFSALFEARRYRCRNALMLVHSFSNRHAWFSDFVDFSKALDIPVKRRGECSAVRMCNGIRLRLAWTSDCPVDRIQEPSDI